MLGGLSPHEVIRVHCAWNFLGISGKSTLATTSVQCAQLQSVREAVTQAMQTGRKEIHMLTGCAWMHESAIVRVGFLNGAAQVEWKSWEELKQNRVRLFNLGRRGEIHVEVVLEKTKLRHTGGACFLAFLGSNFWFLFCETDPQEVLAGEEQAVGDFAQGNCCKGEYA